MFDQHVRLVLVLLSGTNRPAAAETKALKRPSRDLRSPTASTKSTSKTPAVSECLWTELLTTLQYTPKTPSNLPRRISATPASRHPIVLLISCCPSPIFLDSWIHRPAQVAQHEKSPGQPRIFSLTHALGSSQLFLGPHRSNQAGSEYGLARATTGSRQYLHAHS